jgi:hypothetical protein
MQIAFPLPGSPWVGSDPWVVTQPRRMVAVRAKDIFSGSFARCLRPQRTMAEDGFSLLLATDSVFHKKIGNNIPASPKGNFSANLKCGNHLLWRFFRGFSVQRNAAVPAKIIPAARLIGFLLGKRNAHCAAYMKMRNRAIGTPRLCSFDFGSPFSW